MDRDPNALPPDRFVQREVSDLQVEIGRFDERIRNLEKNQVTREEIANRRADALRLALSLLVPVLAAALGALAIMFAGVFQTVAS